MKIFSLVSLALLASCAQPAPERIPGDLPRTGEVLATVNGKNVTQSMLDAALSVMPEEVRKQVEESGRVDQLKESVITQDVLYQEAIARNLTSDTVVQTRLILSERDALIESLLQQVAQERTTDEVLKAWYDEHLVQFRKNEVKASHILLDTEAEAKEIIGQLKGGADFVELAKLKSKDPSAKTNGGDLGWFSKNKMVKEFAEAAFAAEPGLLEEAVKTQFGFHVIQVHEKKDEVTPFEEVKDGIRSRVQQEQVSAYVEEMRTKAISASVDASKENTATAEEASKAGGKADAKADSKPDAKAAGKAGGKADAKAGGKAAKAGE